MIDHPGAREVLNCFTRTRDRYESHRRAAPLIAELCGDRGFLFDVIRARLSSGFLHSADNLSLPVFESGDVGLAINLFAPIRDRAADVTFDNVHHHGWRLLTTGLLSGDGYESILFRRRSHENRTDGAVHLEVDEVYHFGPGDLRFVDSHTAHVVFHPPSLTSTLALWSADRVRVNQGIKRGLGAFPGLRKAVARSIHAVGLGRALGLNAVDGLYFHPEQGRMVETRNYSKPRDGDRAEVLACMFVFFQQVGFDDVDCLRRAAKTAPPEAVDLIDRLVSGEPIPDVGIRGHPRRRFTKMQILQAIEDSRPRSEEPSRLSPLNS